VLYVVYGGVSEPRVQLGLQLREGSLRQSDFAATTSPTRVGRSASATRAVVGQQVRRVAPTKTCIWRRYTQQTPVRRPASTGMSSHLSTAPASGTPASALWRRSCSHGFPPRSHSREQGCIPGTGTQPPHRCEESGSASIQFWMGKRGLSQEASGS